MPVDDAPENPYQSPPKRSIPPLSEKDRQLVFSKEKDEKSIEESKVFAEGLSAEALKKRADANEAERTEIFRNHFETLSLVSLYVIWLVVAVVGLSWAYHLITQKVGTFCRKPKKTHYKLL